MIGKPWRKMVFLGGYGALNVHRIYMMNSGLIILEDLLVSGQFLLVGFNEINLSGYITCFFV